MALLCSPTGHFGITSVYLLLALSLILPSTVGSPVSIANTPQATITESKPKKNQSSPPWDTPDEYPQSSDDDDDSYLIFDDMIDYWNYYPYTTAIRTDLSEDEHSFFGGLGARTRDAEQREIDQTYLWFLPAKTITSVETLYGQTTTETDLFTVTTTATVISHQTVTVRATVALNKDLPPLEEARTTESYPPHLGVQPPFGSNGNKESSHNYLDGPVTTGLLFAEDTGGWLDPDSSNSVDPPILTPPGSIWPVPTGSMYETRDPNTELQAFAWPTNPKKTKTATLPNVSLASPEQTDITERSTGISDVATAEITKGPEPKNQSEDRPRPIPMALLPKENQFHNTHTMDLNRRTASPHPRRLCQFHTFRPRPLRQAKSIVSGQSSNHKNDFGHPKTQIIAEINLLTPSTNPLKLVQNAEIPRKPAIHGQPDYDKNNQALVPRPSLIPNRLKPSMLTKRAVESTAPGRSNVIFHGRQKQGSEPGTPTENKPPMENQVPGNKSKETPAVEVNPEKVIPADNEVTDSKSDQTAPGKGQDNPKENKPADNKVTDSKLDGTATEKEEDKPNEDQPMENPVAVETPTEDTIVEIGDQNITVVPEPTSSNSNNSDSSIIITVLRVAQIVGFIVIGIVLATLVVLLFIWCSQPLWWPCCLKRKHKKQEMKQNQNNQHDPVNDRETLPTTPAPPQQTPPSTTHQTTTAPPQQNPPSTTQQNSTAPSPPKVPTTTNPVSPTTPGNAQTTLAPPTHQASASSGGSSKTSGKTSSTKKFSHSTKVSSQNNNVVAAPALTPSPSPSKPPPQIPSNTPEPTPAPVPAPAPSKPPPPVPHNAPAQVSAPTKPPSQVPNKVPSSVPIPVPSGVPSPATPALPIPAPSSARVPSATPNTAIVPPQKPQDIPATDEGYPATAT
ncbi:Protein of unknown function [Pyronema omphalodes CBS 100304]|uniref:Uncharacterized protein n=1 Tax=Pyronema omphalodes (strain CBS 100304) TaxID=1076935 RepID=U4LED7_PYROM|nr:Protein of unknown function [Pyronema omphalodes CBS 100304]